jgi:uroporphyrinogen decarboxylase
MNSKDRFLAAISNEIPDRVPCTPDISNYIPGKRSGLPFWDIYFKEKLPLWKAYIEACNNFGIDQWVASVFDTPVDSTNSNFEVHTRLKYDQSKDAMIKDVEYDTPDGKLDEQFICFRQEPPARLSRLIKDFDRDWQRYKWLILPPTSLDVGKMEEVRSLCREHGQAFGCSIGYPGFHMWEGSVEGSIETLTFRYFDDPASLDRWFEHDLEFGTKKMELLLAEKPDYILFGGSGTLTMASPELVHRYVIPSLKIWSKMARKANIPTMLHSCGKSRLLVDMLVEHTDISCINPLEMAPMGDVDLAEVKLARGMDIALMGNLHTTDTMLYGTPEDVYRAAVHALDVAKDDGGFILSTGDQCPIDTPDENLLAMLQAVEDHGYY